MIRSRLLMGGTAIALVLVGCSGSDDSTSTPTPTPSSSATSTATPTPTYSAFPLTAAAQFFPFNASTSFTGDLASGTITLGAVTSEAPSNRVSLAVSNAPTTGTYAIMESTDETRFAATAPTVAPATTVKEYVFSSAGDGGKFARVEFLNNTIPSVVTADAALARTRVSYAAWYRGDSTTGSKRITYTAWGYPTATTDVPTASTYAYTSRVTGRLVSSATGASALDKVGGTVTLSINYATSVVNMTLVLTRVAADGTETAFSTFTAQGAIPAGSSQFSGSFLTGPLAGTFNGGLFGSQGAEVGLTFALSGTQLGVGQRLVGVVVGAR
jgi:hypothetical protein